MNFWYDLDFSGAHLQWVSLAQAEEVICHFQKVENKLFGRKPWVGLKIVIIDVHMFESEKLFALETSHLHNFFTDGHFKSNFFKSHKEQHF